MVFVIAFGSFMVNPTNWHPFMPSGFGGVMSGAAIVFFAFIGFDAVSTTAEETQQSAARFAHRHDREPHHLHAALCADVGRAHRHQKIHGLPRRFRGGRDGLREQTWAQALVSAGALAGLTSVLLVFQLGQPRIFMAMARDGLLPQYFARIHPRFRTPYITTIWTGVVVGGVAMFTDIGSLADLTNIGTLFAFVLVCLGVIVLRRTDRSVRVRFAFRLSRSFRSSA